MKVLTLTLNGVDADNYSKMTEKQRIEFVSKHLKINKETVAKLLGYGYKCERVQESAQVSSENRSIEGDCSGGSTKTRKSRKNNKGN